MRHFICLTTAFFITVSTAFTAEDEIQYGEVYILDSSGLKQPNLNFSVSYGINITNSFLELDSLIGAAQLRVWRYISTGVLSFANFSELSSAGKELRKLEDIDVHIKIPTPRWGLFSYSTLELMLGKWNVFNFLPLESELVLGGGAGVLNRGKDNNGKTEQLFSYLWSAEHRFIIHKNFGLSFALLGHIDTSYLAVGTHFRF